MKPSSALGRDLDCALVRIRALEAELATVLDREGRLLARFACSRRLMNAEQRSVTNAAAREAGV